MSNSYTLEQAKEYVKNNEVDKTFYPKLNYAAPVGWINDPNGVVVYNEELHLFYQHYPYDSVHGKMHWGHAKTKDGLNWDNLEVALAPDQPYDKDGVFSGSAIVKDNKLFLMYSGHIVTEDGNYKQVQNIAFSEDGVNFTKYENNPVIDENDVPEGSSIVDFRDPKVFEKDGKYYTVIGSKTIDDKGQVLLYVSDDLIEWEFQSIILPYNEFLGDMVECPDLIFFENQDAFLLSAMNYTDKETGKYYPHISWIIEGEVDWDTFVFEVASVRKMDGGFDYYAPQTALSASNPNEYTAIAWQQAWNRTLPTHDQRHKWSGQMTIPRLLKEENNKIMQYPSPRLKSKLSILHEIEDLEIKNNNQFDFDEEYISFTMEPTKQLKLTLSNENNEKVWINFDGGNQIIDFSRKDSIKIVDSNDKVFDEISYPIPLNDESWSVEVFVDTSSIQIFVNNYYTLTSTFYAENPLNRLVLESKDEQPISKLKIGKLTPENGGK